jgi:hypothetical protein
LKTGNYGIDKDNEEGWEEDPYYPDEDRKPKAMF